ncbi:YncE family protein [Streptomyces phaeolivaceus]|uniref:YncE family protein n=2 Tax=Streptomyces phaeolivaceus TaxID=2653200 RepID=A0A5P8K3E6_9ACTN|nr:YncE family protein [Streptomyces phaeolivaceus]
MTAMARSPAIGATGAAPDAQAHGALYRRAPSVQLPMLTNKRATRDRGTGRSVPHGPPPSGPGGAESHVPRNTTRLDSGPTPPNAPTARRATGAPTSPHPTSPPPTVHPNRSRLTRERESGGAVMATEHDRRDRLAAERADTPLVRLLDTARARGHEMVRPPDPTAPPAPSAPAAPRPLSTIRVGESPHSLAVSPDGTRLYVSDFKADSVVVVDLPREEVVDTVAVDDGPYGVAASPDGTRLHVAVPDTELLLKIEFPDDVSGSHFGHAPYGVAAGPDGQRVYLALALEDRVWVTDQFAMGDFASVPGLDFPVGVAVSPDEKYLYVTHYFAGRVSVVDLGRTSVISTIPVSNGPYGVTVTRDGSRLYVAHFPYGTVSVIDTARGEVTDTIAVADGSRGVAVSPDGSRLYVTDFFAGTVSVLRP